MKKNYGYIYFVSRGNYQVMVEKEEWENDWLGWWNRTHRSGN